MWFLIKRRSSHKYLDNDICVPKLGRFFCYNVRTKYTGGRVTVYWLVTPIIHV